MELETLNQRLLDAAEDGRPGDAVQWCALVARGADINCQDVDGRTPLICAAIHGRIGVVVALLRIPAIQVDLPMHVWIGFTSITDMAVLTRRWLDGHGFRESPSTSRMIFLDD